MKLAVFVLAVLCGVSAIELSNKPLLHDGRLVLISKKPLLNGDSNVVISQKPILNGDSNVVISQKPILNGENLDISQKPIFHETSEDPCDICFSQMKELVAELSRTFSA